MTIAISNYARQYVDYKPITEPGLDAWEASFDNGTTWIPGVALDGADAGWFRWLVAGHRAQAGDAVAVLAGNAVNPILRATDNPEVVIIRPGTIYIT